MTTLIAVCTTDNILLDLLSVTEAAAKFDNQSLTHLKFYVSDLASTDPARRLIELNFPEPISAELLIAAFSLDEDACHRIIEREWELEFGQSN